MPRNVRPSWCELSVDNVSNGPSVVKATGPKGRTGTLSALFKVRHNGAPVDFLRVDMIGSADGSRVAIEVVDLRTGRVLIREDVAQ